MNTFPVVYARMKVISIDLRTQGFNLVENLGGKNFVSIPLMLLALLSTPAKYIQAFWCNESYSAH